MRQWATPITIGAFALSAITGIMLFFKVQLGLIKPVHEWLSWLLVLGTVFHIIANWQATVKYVSKPIGKGILIFFLILICVSFIPNNGQGQSNHRSGMLSNTLTQAPLQDVAQIAKHKPDEALDILKSQGIYAENKEQSIRDIAVNNQITPIEVLDIIF